MIFVLFLLLLCYAEKFDGEANLKGDGFEFLMKFCSKTTDDISKASAHFHIQLQVDFNLGYPNTTYYIAFYDDEETSWEEVCDVILVQ